MKRIAPIRDKAIYTNEANTQIGLVLRARLVPEPTRRQEDVDRAINSIKALRRRVGRITIQDLLAARHEGHDR